MTHACRAGAISNSFSCHRGRLGSNKNYAEGFDYFHIEPFSPCIASPSGRLAVDYTIRYEMLHEDLPAFVAWFNRQPGSRLPAGAQPLAFGELEWQKKGALTRKAGATDEQDSALAYAELYRRCGTRCSQLVGAYFQEDVAAFGMGALAAGPLAELVKPPEEETEDEGGG